jgi:hypothetical protein
MFQLHDSSQHGIILKMAKSGSVNKVGASIVGGIYLLRIKCCPNNTENDAQYPLLLERLEASQRCGVLTETVRAFPASYPCAATTRCSGSSIPQRPWWTWMPFVIHLTIVYTHGGTGN